MTDARLRREFRRFVLEHHPDRGGDPEVFRAGVAAYRAAAGGDIDPPRYPPVSAYRRRRGPAAVLARLRRVRQSRGRPRRVR